VFAVVLGAGGNKAGESAIIKLVKNIEEIPKRDRPREKLVSRGPSALTDVELLALMLGSGTKNQPLLELAAHLLGHVDKANGGLGVTDLEAIPGIGRAKSCSLLAALEFARRRIRPEGTKIRDAADILPLVQHLAHRQQEHFVCISLNGAHEIIASRVVTVGLVNASQIHPREVFCDPIKDRACAIVIAHNHPSGELKPSSEDIAVTKRIAASGETLGIAVLDHVIFSKRGFISLRDMGVL